VRPKAPNRNGLRSREAPETVSYPECRVGVQLHQRTCFFCRHAKTTVRKRTKLLKVFQNSGHKRSPGDGRAHRGFRFPFGGKPMAGREAHHDVILMPPCVFSATLTVYCAMSCCRPSLPTKALLKSEADDIAEAKSRVDRILAS
jgi:hypothetical protein